MVKVQRQKDFLSCSKTFTWQAFHPPTIPEPCISVPDILLSCLGTQTKTPQAIPCPSTMGSTSKSLIYPDKGLEFSVSHTWFPVPWHSRSPESMPQRCRTCRDAGTGASHPVFTKNLKLSQHCCLPATTLRTRSTAGLARDLWAGEPMRSCNPVQDSGVKQLKAAGSFSQEENGLSGRWISA